MHILLVLLPQMSENYQKNIRCFAKQAEPLAVKFSEAVSLSFNSQHQFCGSKLHSYTSNLLRQESQRLFKRHPLTNVSMEQFVNFWLIL